MHRNVARAYRPECRLQRWSPLGIHWLGVFAWKWSFVFGFSGQEGFLEALSSESECGYCGIDTDRKRDV